VSLVGNSSELSLVDLIQVKGHSPTTCRLLVQGRRGSGEIFLDRGVVIFAGYDGMQGESAAHALLSEHDVVYRATSDVPPPVPNMAVEHRALLLQAAVANDESRRTPPELRAPVRTSTGARRGALAAPAEGPGVPRRGPIGLVRWAAVALALGAVGAAVFGQISVRRSEAAASAIPAPPPAPAPAPVEASQLRTPRDELPVLIAGEPPASPEPGLALRPTIVLRLLVDANGNVAQAEVYRSRPELARFEEAAVGAARRFAFRPGRREGVPLGVWINWPVDFL
jgi:TonB family protein